ncbi:MAG: CoA-binding protein [Thermodesulfobacteriota bacterium]|nr:CoA-binding protein [Thermodesulfobacteriota bacterium]
MELRRLFYPESIAVIGASPNIGGGKMPYYQILQMAGYSGRLYPVNPKYDEIEGTQVYHSIDDLPEAVDFIIASVPSMHALDIVKQACRNKAGFIHFFTSGFSEIGEVEIEDAMLDVAREHGLRIVGPNCIGVHCTESGVSCDLPRQWQSPGDVGFLSQSGGMTNNFMRMANSRKIQLNKLVSYGNQMDLKVEDYLEYLAQDDDVRAIAAYIEDIKDGRRFIQALKDTSRHKPLIILKGGVTSQGAKAAASHTGAMAGHFEIWSAVMRQFGCIEVDTFEHMIDMLVLATASRIPDGHRIGFLGSGGGTSVLLTDMAALSGLELPELDSITQEQIASRISNVNTSTVNPVDLGFYGFDFDIMAHTMSVMDTDDNIDMILPYFSMDFITSFEKSDVSEGALKIAETINRMNKPVIPILSKFTEDVEIERTRIAFYNILRAEGIPVYQTIQDAIYSISGILRWVDFIEKGSRPEPGAYLSSL